MQASFSHAPQTAIIRQVVSIVTTLFCLSANAEVWVITDHQHLVQGTPDRLIELDAPAHIEAELSSGLPSDPARASEIVRQRLGDRKLQQQLHEAYQGVADAWSLGVTKIPAVVVDRRYVVYGEADVLRAVARVEAYRSARP
jgi:integrating conjugative element protein (TIGR03757 family)